MAPETATKTPAQNRETTRASWLDAAAPYAHIPLRVALASIFLFHGFSKLSAGVGGFAEMMGLPLAVAALVAVGEVGIGVFAIAGGLGRTQYADLMTRLAGLGAIIIMAGAIAMAHAPRWNFVATPDFPMGGMEFQVSLALLGLYLVLRGNRI